MHTEAGRLSRWGQANFLFVRGRNVHQAPKCTVYWRCFAVQVCDSFTRSKLYAAMFLRVNCEGQISAQGILHLRNPNLDPNSGKRILGARILDPNSWVEFFESVFSSKRGPQKNSPSRNSPLKIHLPKFNPEIGPKNSHCTSAGPFD